jgi:hypothetical protein
MTALTGDGGTRPLPTAIASAGPGAVVVGATVFGLPLEEQPVAVTASASAKRATMKRRIRRC